MKRLLFSVLVFSLLLTACQPQQETSIPASPTLAATEAVLPTPTATSPGPIVVTDALGRVVRLPAAPQRIVITGRALIMIADAAYIFPQAAERIVGLGDASQGTGNFISLIDPNYAAKAVLERDASAEQIAALQPDLVILKSYLAESIGQPVEALGIPVVYVDFETPEQYFRDLAILGQVFQDEARAEEAIAYYQSVMERVRQAVSPAERRPRVLLLYYTSRDGSVAFNVPPLPWMQTRLVEMAGGEPVWADANPGGGWTQVSFEQIAAWDADQIFIISYSRNPSEVTAELRADPTWQALRAVRENRLYAFAADFYSWDQPDTRWILGLLWLAGKLHPEQFPGLDLVAEAQAFYQTLYGLDENFFTENIRPAFKGDLP
ncbi:MAG: ABC transporter substrate-binding protein [Anaerolineales bacterium]